MIGLTIHLDGDNCWPDAKDYVAGELQSISRLRNGTALGNSTIAVRVKLLDGRIVLAETSMRLFLAAAQAFETAEQMDITPGTHQVPPQ